MSSWAERAEVKPTARDGGDVTAGYESAWALGVVVGMASCVLMGLLFVELHILFRISELKIAGRCQGKTPAWPLLSLRAFVAYKKGETYRLRGTTRSLIQNIRYPNRDFNPDPTAERSSNASVHSDTQPVWQKRRRLATNWQIRKMTLLLSCVYLSCISFISPVT
jgi:hypothetical protein